MTFAGAVIVGTLSYLAVYLIAIFFSETLDDRVDREESIFRYLKYRIQNSLSKYETYQIAKIHYKDDSRYEWNDLVYILDGDVKVPITCSKKDKEKIYQLQRMNPERDVWIKAKINRGELELIKIKGYTVK